MPHPDPIKLDPRAGAVRITPRMTEEENEEWDRTLGIRDGYQEECEWLAKQIETETDPDLL